MTQLGLGVAVERIESKHKLSQNRPTGDRERVIEALRAGARPDDHALADYMAAFAIPQDAAGDADR